MSFNQAHCMEAQRKNYSIDEWYGCVRKLKLEKGAAVGMRRRLNRLRKKSDHEFTEYQCQYCGSYHVGRQMILTAKRKRHLDVDARLALAEAIDRFIKSPLLSPL